MSKLPQLTMDFRAQRGEFNLQVAADIPLRGVTGIYGESGAGKTTLLRCIAGLEQPTSGTITVAGDPWFADGVAVPVQQRDVGYVFQEPRLFQHLNVQQNIDYGLRRGSGGGPASAEVTALLGIDGLLQRRPAALSGGELQRVAIARALLRGPRLLLMDEPLASLDAGRKHNILPFLDRLHSEAAVPIVYVSHSMEELCRLCDHLLLLADGQVVANGELQSVLVDLDNTAISAEQAGSVIAGKVAHYDAADGLTQVIFSGGEIWLPGKLGTKGADLRLRVLASDISLSRDANAKSTILNRLEVVIEDIQDTQAPTQLVRIAAGDEKMIARITRRSRQELDLQPGQTVVAQLKAAAVRQS